ncbi:hypothetical protein MFLO_01100 [Listeria floridensis FSL S10-1187]|uniref:Uncharacterized protein n=1 Tax=Listeria floridensis FSL S10-1187 TaxID=1265817 RepID=A0ABP3B1G2_9LIST|nr:hypothetical protein [Listeria floridensis]EUJ33786.1 hypothetical protein MFLO_01100 [Listeria floridensis FSL S10-1187]
MFDQDYIHLVFRRAITSDGYYRVYLGKDTLTFIKLGGQFHHRNALFQSGLMIPIFYLPYKFAQARQEKRTEYVEKLFQEKGVQGLAADKDCFQVKKRELAELEMTEKPDFKKVLSNYDYHVNFTLKDNKKLKMAVAFGESHRFIRRKLQEFNYLHK